LKKVEILTKVIKFQNPQKLYRRDGQV